MNNEHEELTRWDPLGVHAYKSPEGHWVKAKVAHDAIAKLRERIAELEAENATLRRQEPADPPVGRREFCATTQLLKSAMLTLSDLHNGAQGLAREEALEELNAAADSSIYLDMVARLGEEAARRNAVGYFYDDEIEKIRKLLPLDIDQDARGAGKEG